MKNKSLKLTINKSVVSRLSKNQQAQIVGGETETCGGSDQCTHGPQEETYYCDPYMTDPEANFLSSIKSCTGFLCCEPTYTCDCCTGQWQPSCTGGTGQDTY